MENNSKRRQSEYAGSGEPGRQRKRPADAEGAGRQRPRQASAEAPRRQSLRRPDVTASEEQQRGRPGSGERPGAQRPGGTREGGRKRGGRGSPELSPAAQRGRQKRMEQKRLRLKRLFRRLLMALAVLAVMALIFIFGFRLRNVNVTGNSRYTKEEILDLIQYDEQYHNTVLFYLEKRHMDIEGVPFINAIHMEIGSNDTINVEVAEKIVTGCIKDGGRYIYIDTDGYVCEISDTRQDNVPLIAGLEFEAPVLNEILNVTDQSVYSSLLNLTLLLKKHELSIEEVIFAEDATMQMQMGKIKVMLGGPENMEDKITELKNLMPQLEGLSGTLHLENYDSSRDSIIFTKDS